jgi:hypothetical protein
MPNAESGAGAAIPAFNIPCLPVMRPVIAAVAHQDSAAADHLADRDDYGLPGLRKIQSI